MGKQHRHYNKNELSLTKHAIQRSAQRNLSDADIEYVIEHGRCERACEGLGFFLGRNNIPSHDRHNDTVTRLEGVTVITDLSGSKVITAWRNREQGSKHLRRRLCR